METTVQPRPSERKKAVPHAANKKYKVDVYADDSSGTLQFYLQPGDADTLKQLKGIRLKFAPGPDWYDVEYNLDDSQSSMRVKFKQSEPICIQPGVVCPAKGSGNGSNGQVSLEDTRDKKLLVQNKNQNAETFSYSLFFTDLTDNDVGELDPIYDNGGGGHP